MSVFYSGTTTVFSSALNFTHRLVQSRLHPVLNDCCSPLVSTLHKVSQTLCKRTAPSSSPCLINVLLANLVSEKCSESVEREQGQSPHLSSFQNITSTANANTFPLIIIHKVLSQWHCSLRVWATYESMNVQRAGAAADTLKMSHSWQTARPREACDYDLWGGVRVFSYKLR